MGMHIISSSILIVCFFFFPLRDAAACAIISPVASVVIGAVGAFLANITAPFLLWLKIDDAVGATCVHGT